MVSGEAKPEPGRAEAQAQRFHETYERLAPSFGYETRKESAKPWAEVPEQNRRLMIAVCAELLGAERPSVEPQGEPDPPPWYMRCPWCKDTFRAMVNTPKGYEFCPLCHGSFYFGKPVRVAARGVEGQARQSTELTAASTSEVVERISTLEAQLADSTRREEELAKALEQIVALKPEPFDFPNDWEAQVAACAECKRWKHHPIQQGICDAHRRPLWAREKWDEDEEKRLGYRAHVIARDALAARAPRTS